MKQIQVLKNKKWEDMPYGNWKDLVEDGWVLEKVAYSFPSVVMSRKGHFNFFRMVDEEEGYVKKKKCQNCGCQSNGLYCSYQCKDEDDAKSCVEFK